MENNRTRVKNLALSWVGKDVKQHIIDTYNTAYQRAPRKIMMQPNWYWCACTWSALAIECDLLDIMPIEISCGELIKEAKRRGIWVEDDSYIPDIGDAVLYDWDDNKVGDNVGWPDHIGTVVDVYKDAGYFVVMEGNYNNAVKLRTVSINGGFIRGFITPEYGDDFVESSDNVIVTPAEVTIKSVSEVAHEVISGKWGSGKPRKDSLEKAGYNYREVQDEVNRILNGGAVEPANQEQNQKQPFEKKITSTCSAKGFKLMLSGIYRVDASPFLYCRNDAGTNKKALCKIPNGTFVRNYGFYNTSNGVKWLYIQFILDGVQYTGYSSSTYLTKIQ